MQDNPCNTIPVMCRLRWCRARVGVLHWHACVQPHNTMNMTRPEPSWPRVHAGKRVKLAYEQDADATNPEEEVGADAEAAAREAPQQRKYRGARVETPSHPGMLVRCGSLNYQATGAYCFQNALLCSPSDHVPLVDTGHTRDGPQHTHASSMYIIPMCT